MHRFLRKTISILLRFSPSEKFSDFLLWPVARRIFGRYTEIVEIQKGIFLKVYGDMEDMVNKLLMFTSGYMSLAWEPGTARLAQKLAAKTSCAVTAGSHIGYYAVILAAMNRSAKVYAFEPNPINFERCKENISINKLTQVEVVQSALGNQIGNQKMYFDFGQSSLLESSRKHAGEGVVQITTLDHFFAQKQQKPDLLILDVEGYESNVFEGGKEIISAHHPDIIFELNPRALEAAHSSVDALKRILEKERYSLFVIDEGDHGVLYEPNLQTKLVPFDSFDFTQISFVNIFATIHSEKAKEGAQERT